MAAFSRAVLAVLGSYSEYFALLGVCVVLYCVFKFTLTVVWGFIVHFLAGPLGLSKNLAKLGKWAVVTGSTDGIGKAYAMELARRGMNIVLISRSPEKLLNVALEIEGKYRVKTKTIPIDFTHGPEIYDKIKKEFVALEIGVLVNNVGVGMEHPEYLLDVTEGEKYSQNMINVNATSMVRMTYLVLPGMVDRKKGVILNISSGSGLAPLPLLTVYSATKAFADFFSRGINAEYKHFGITVQSVLPLFVSTKMSKIRRTSFFVPSPTKYAKAALNTVGLQNRTFGCLAHGIQAWLMNLAPACVMGPVAFHIMKQTRAVALKRKAAKKE